MDVDHRTAWRWSAELQRAELGGLLFESSSIMTPAIPTRYVVFFEQGGLSLPDESYYREEHFAPVREAFVAHVERMFELAGLSTTPRRAPQRVFDLETRSPVSHWDNVESRDSQKTYNLDAVGRAIRRRLRRRAA